MDVRDLLKAVPIARDRGGRVWRMQIEERHVLIAAGTGGGKGSWIWTLVLGLIPAWQAGLVKFWGCDPKMIELSMGRDYWDYYADNDADSVAMLEHCVQEMDNRTRLMQGVSRKFTPSVTTPLNVVVIDELGYLSALMPDKKLRERANTAVTALLAKGRAPGFAVVGAVQDPRKETVNNRDLFAVRIAGRLPSAMVDLVLGEGAYEAGAYCDRIPMPPVGAGVAYVLDELDMKPRLLRAPWCSDEAIRGVLARMPSRVVNGAWKVKDEHGTIPLTEQPGWQFTVE